MDIWREICQRFSFGKELYLWGWRWIVFVIWGLPYGCASVYDFLQGQEFLPRTYPKVSEVIPLWLSSAWLIIGVVAIMIVTFEGAYRFVQRNKALAELHSSKNQLRPNLELAANPEVIRGHMHDSKTGMPISDELFAASVMIRNNPKTHNSESDAKDVYSLITYYDSESKKELIGNIFGNWNEKGYDRFPQPLLQEPHGSDLREITLKSTGLPYRLILAIKYKEDNNCYAFGPDSLHHQGLRNPLYELVGQHFRISVNLIGKDVNKVFEFQLHNHGKGKGMDIATS